MTTPRKGPSEEQREKPASYALWNTNLLVASLVAAGMVASMLMAGLAELPTIIIGIPPFLYMLYAILASRSARNARKAEENYNRSTITILTLQCEMILSRIDELLKKSPGSLYAYLAVIQLSTIVRLFNTRYGRYLNKKGITASQETEKMIIDASIPGERGIESYVAPIIDQIRIIRDSVLDIDDPSLRAMREAP